MIDYSKAYGVVLEAGGTRGAYQIGVLRALTEKGTKIKGVVGTSIGAINGALFVQGDIDKANEVWGKIKFSQVITDEDGIIEKIAALNYKQLNITTFLDKTIKVAKDKGVDSQPFKKLLYEYIDEDKMRNSNIDYGLVTISLSDRKPYELFIDNIEKGQIANYVLASAYLPVFKREKINGKHYVDGAFYNRRPTQMLLGKGYTDVIVVKIQGTGIVRRASTKGINIIEISPQEELGKLLEFSSSKIKYNIDLGYFDTFKVLNGLKGDSYYIRSTKTEINYINSLLRIKPSTAKKLNRNIFIDNIPLERLLMEEVIPSLAKRFNLRRDWTYEELVITMIDRAALAMGLNRFRIYDYEEVVGILKANMKSYKENIDYYKLSRELDHLLTEIIEVL